MHLVSEELPLTANEPWTRCSAWADMGEGQAMCQGVCFSGEKAQLGGQGRISGEGSLHWALKGPSDMEMQMCKERYFWKQKHLEQRQGDGKGVLLCTEQRPRRGTICASLHCGRAVNDVHTCEGHSFQLLFGVWEGWGPAKRQGVIGFPKNTAIPWML